MQLEAELNRAEHKEKLVQRICKIGIVATFILMLIGGSEVFGGFDPWDADATVVSMILGIVYLIAAVASVMLVAYYFSNLRPRIRRLRDDVLQQSIHELQHELRDLRNEMNATRRTDDGGTT